jgi:tyrosyl-tRNA synthetase
MFFKKAAAIDTDEKKIDELLERGVADALPTKESLKKLLLSGKKLRIKLGIDPTGAKLHLGNTVPLLKLRDFQELGHQVVLIIGDATGVVGDTSDKDAERPMLTEAHVEENMRTFAAQAGKILKKDQLEIRHNSEWLLKLNYRDIGEHADVFSVADFIARDNIKRRLDAGKRVSLREVLYPLMQGYDSVAVRADVELGGNDQRFNVLAGRPLQEKLGQPPQHCLLFELMPGTDGEKMSKSRGNVINIDDAPGEMFGRVMSMRDDVIKAFFISATRVPQERAEQILAGHPKEAKIALAEELVRMYHGETAAKKAREDFAAVFSKGEAPKDVKELSLKGSLMETLVAGGVIESNSEYRRLQEAGAIRFAESDEALSGSESVAGRIIRIGKHRFVKILDN